MEFVPLEMTGTPMLNLVLVIFLMLLIGLQKELFLLYKKNFCAKQVGLLQLLALLKVPIS